ncbi:hypothetical protein BGX38DRAFT_103449 [Terfezia claveryi]|nr:hypothetical protein BGX38DRAFT_103449 [Terfezia claveryi]
MLSKLRFYRLKYALRAQTLSLFSLLTFFVFIILLPSHIFFLSFLSHRLASHITASHITTSHITALHITTSTLSYSHISSLLYILTAIHPHLYIYSSLLLYILSESLFLPIQYSICLLQSVNVLQLGMIFVLS